MKLIAITLALFVAPVYADACTRMKATDTLILNGRRQPAERFIECSVGHWPNVHSVFYERVSP